MIKKLILISVAAIFCMCCPRVEDKIILSKKRFVGIAQSVNFLYDGWSYTQVDTDRGFISVARHAHTAMIGDSCFIHLSTDGIQYGSFGNSKKYYMLKGVSCKGGIEEISKKGIDNILYGGE